MSGNGERRIHLIEIQVSGDAVNATVFPHWPRDHQRKSRRGTLDDTPQRHASISLLVKLLRHHSDLRHSDLISDELYAELLAAAGRELFELLFVGGLTDDVADALGRFAEEEIDLLRIKLSFQGAHAPWLAGLPWEYLHTPLGDEHFDAPGVFLSKRAELMLSRWLEARNMRELGDARPLHVLVVCPRPPHRNGEDPVVEQVDPTKVIEHFRKLEETGRITLDTLIDDANDVPVENPLRVTRRVLKQRIRAKDKAPVILHFVGHGRRFDGQGQLLLSRTDGKQDWIGAEDFAALVERRSVKLVFLQACESALPDQYIPFSGVAERLALSGLPAVVAMQYRIKTELATAFTQGFYDELLKNSAIDVAVEVGRERIDDQMDDRDRLAFGLPVVYLASHEGMLLDEIAGPGEKPLDRNDVPGSGGPCPRCGTIRRRADAGACQKCGLPFVCVKGHVIPDPINDEFCDECGVSIHRETWVADRFPGAGPTAPAAAQDVLTMLDGPKERTP